MERRLFLVLPLLAACSSEPAPAPTPDASADASADAPADVSVDAPADTATDTPADTAVDAQADASADATADTPAPTDGPADASGDAAADAPADGGATFMALAPCTMPTDYMDGTTVMFGGAIGTMYSPRCIRVRAGSSVTFSGEFSSHPLHASTRGTTPNPIPRTSTGSSASVTFPTAGFFPYYCEFHGTNDGMAMAGVVQVTP